MATRNTVQDRTALKAQYLGCLSARSPATLRRTVQSLLRLGVRRDLLLTWAVAAGHDRKYIGKLLSECLTALGVRQRQPGGGRRTAPPALLLLAFAHEVFGADDRKRLRAAWRAASGATAAELAAKGLGTIPEPELYRAAVERFSKKLTKTIKVRNPMKRFQLNTILCAFLLALAFALAPSAASRAQTKFTTAQLANLQPLDPSAVPPFGTFWLLKSPDPDHGYPPLPCPPGDLPGLPIYDLGGGHYLVDDSQVDYAALRQQQEAERALSALEVQYGLSDSPDGGGTFGPMDLTSFTTNDLWLEIITMTNSTGVFVVHPPAAEATNGVYDLFMTTNLTTSVPGLNLTNWAWLLRTDPGETNLIVPDLTADQAFFMLGKTNDLDGDGLTDAFEHLVSHTDPTKWSTRGDGISDLIAYLEGRNPTVPGSLPDTGGAVNLQVYTPLR